jgi:ParB family chromosome partitioning protein
MSSKNLGRGLSAFLDSSISQDFNNLAASVINIGIDKIKANPFQPRRVFNDESLMNLAESIKRNGILQPVIVIKVSDDEYQLVAGERRMRAAKIAEVEKIPAIVKKFSDKEQLEIAILENIQREDLNVIDEADGYKRLIDEFHYTQEELSNVLGKSRSHITNTLRLLSLPEDVKESLRNGTLTFGHARALVGSENASAIAKEVVKNSMNVRQTESYMKQQKHNGGFKNKIANDPELQNVEAQIQSIIGLSVNIKLRDKGGVIEIGFSDFEELDSLINKLNKLSN